MRHRLVPLVFAASFVFEALSHSPSPYAQCDVQDNEQGKAVAIGRVESKTQLHWSYESMLPQARRIFAILVSFLARILRPASYHGSVEKILHGELRTAPPEDVPARILYAGGLDAVARFAGIGNYMQRRAAVDDFLLSLPLPLVATPTLRELWHRIDPAQASEAGSTWGPQGIRVTSAMLNELIADVQTKEDALYEEYRPWNDVPGWRV